MIQQQEVSEDFNASYRASPEFLDFQGGLIAEKLAEVVGRFNQINHFATVSMLAALLEDLGAGSPESAALTDKHRSDAEWWADCATPLEIEAYTAAGLRAIAQGAFCINARKRIMVQLWNSLNTQDRRSFIARAKASDGAA